MPPVTRRRLATLKSAVLLDEDLLSLLFRWVGVRNLQAAAATCCAWRDGVTEAFLSWRCRPGLYLVGGCGDGAHPASAEARQTVLRYDVVGDEWVPCAPLMKARDHHALVGCDGELYALGGWSGTRSRSSCESYSPREDKWTLMPRHRLRTPRSGHGAAVSGGSLFALAGWGGAHTGFLSSLECVTPKTTGLDCGWKAMPTSASLHLARHCPATAAIGHHLYVCGGSGTNASDASLGAQPTASIERLDTRHLDLGWQIDLAPMLMARYRHAMAVIGGILYCTGGQTPDGKATPSVERYDPASDQWQEVAPMLHPRFSHAAATLDGRLYVVGGFASGVWLAAVERYDPATDTWEAVGNLSSPVSAPGLAVC